MTVRSIQVVQSVSAVRGVSLTLTSHNVIDEQVNGVCIARTFA